MPRPHNILRKDDTDGLLLFVSIIETCPCGTPAASASCRRENAVAKGVATRGIYAARAMNAELWDTDGKRYIDFAAGIAVNNAGHRHPKLALAVCRGWSLCLYPGSRFKAA